MFSAVKLVVVSVPVGSVISVCSIGLVLGSSDLEDVSTRAFFTCDSLIMGFFFGGKSGAICFTTGLEVRTGAGRLNLGFLPLAIRFSSLFHSS